MSDPNRDVSATDRAALLRDLEASIPGVVVELVQYPDGRRTVRSVGPGAPTLFGPGAAALGGDLAILFDLVHPEERASLERSLTESARTLTPWRQEVCLHVGGGERWYECVASPRREDGGEIVWRGLALDISERRERDLERLLTQFCVDHASVGVFRIVEPDGRIVSANPQACRSLGYTREELCALTVFDIDPTFTQERWVDHRRNLRQKRSASFETLHRRKDGTVFPVEISVSYFHYRGQDYSFSFSRDVSERKAAEAALHAQQEKYRSVVDNLSLGIVVLDRDLRITSVNEAFRKRFPGADFSRRPFCFHALREPARDAPCEDCSALETFRTGATCERTTQVMMPEGPRTFRIVSCPIKSAGGEVDAVIEIVEDVTDRVKAEAERLQLEQRLHEAQKLEAIGTLAGGIAHDFNNMLSVIIGYAELIKTRLAEDDPSRRDVLTIEDAAIRSRDTTQQLLAFSRRQTISPRPLDVGQHVVGLRRTLARLIGEHIDLRIAQPPELWPVRFDPSQLDQILINLVVNARDALPHGGRVTIALANVPAGSAAGADASLLAGDAVRLVVADDGIGMDAETLARAFEPFFTTKEVGEGTGLGLATVYGIVEQNRGRITIASEPGGGTTVTIDLPREIEATATEPAAAPAPGPAAAAHAEPAATILLVEDDTMVRGLARRMLERLGYTILVAETPHAALEICERTDQPIDLLLTDVVMPGMNGVALRDRVCSLRPQTKTLFMSGYSATVLGRRGELAEGVPFLAKPFRELDLRQAVRAALGRG